MKITDTRTIKSGKTLKRELSHKEKLERAKARIKLLEAENELLKKNEWIEMGLLTDIKFEVIKYVIDKYKLNLF